MIAGSTIGASDSIKWEDKAKDYKSKYEILETQSKELTDKSKLFEDKVKELESKVKDAEPWFSMDSEKREAKEANAKAEAEAQQAALDAKSKTLSNGKYEAGTDFEPGKYNIVAVKGGGNVMCPAAGLNAIMGINQDAMFSDMYQKEYKNITFKKGHVLDIRDVTVKLVQVN